MAEAPSINDVIRAILNAAKSYGPRAGEIVPTVGVQMKLGNSVRADEFNAALAEMVARGWIAPKIGTHFKLTEAGFAEM